MFGLFPIDLRKILLITFVIALPLISINIQRKPGEAPWYFKPFTFSAEVIQLGYSKLVFVVKDTTNEYLNLIDIKKENRELKQKLSEIQTQLSVLDEVKNENSRLSNLLEFREREPMSLIAAKVISFDLFSQYATVRINRGTKHGIEVGQAVVTPQGVVGTILSTDSLLSHVLVVTDRYSVVDAIVQRSRARGIVEGKTQTSAQLKYLQRTDDVQVGDIVVTSGLDPVLPQGIPIGKIATVDKKPYGVTQMVEVDPMINASQLEEVFVVTKVNKTNIVENETTEKNPEKNKK